MGTRPAPAATATPGLAAVAALDADAALALLGSRATGLSGAEAEARLASFGHNGVAAEPTRHVIVDLLAQLARPLPLLLLALAGIDVATGQPLGAVVIGAIVVLSALLGIVQERRSGNAVRRLRALVHTTVRALRADADKAGGAVEVPLDQLVPGDVVVLSAGDPVPADVRFLDTNDLFVDQAALTGESLPVAKHARALADAAASAGDAASLANIGFMGAHVTSGGARALVVATGPATGFGHVAAALAQARETTPFERDIDRVIALLLRFMALMAPLVFLLNLVTKHDWYEALLFATAVAVGLAPEMLPMIVTVNLARGALLLAGRKVIVKRLGAVQALGAIDVLCTDKTGTLTQDRVVLLKHVDIDGHDSERVLDYAYLNSRHQTGLHNLLDKAVLDQPGLPARLDTGWRKLGEIPFDFERRRMSVVLEGPDGVRILVCKGAVDEITGVCSAAERGGVRVPFEAAHAATLGATADGLNADGLRVIAIACRTLAPGEAIDHDSAAERDLTLMGYIAFFDPPRESAAAAIAGLRAHGVDVKVLSGDVPAVCAHVCRLVGIDATAILDGATLERMSDDALAQRVATTQVFAKLSPAQKTRVIQALQARGRVVGFLGDGVNDGPALKRADVGIAVDSGTDVARDAADLVLLEKSLLAVDEGIAIGRTVFGNVVKYVRMSASSNFGNMLSVVGASVLLPFLPMAPLQVLLNNLLYDCSQTAVTTDRVEAHYLAAPRRWELASLRRYVLCFGPLSSLFDYATFALLWFGLGARHAPALFQSGWFVESLLSQALVVYVLRASAAPWAAVAPSRAMVAATIAVCAAGVWLPYAPFAHWFGLVPLPPGYWWGLVVILPGYLVLVQLAKAALVRRFGIDRALPAVGAPRLDAGAA